MFSAHSLNSGNRFFKDTGNSGSSENWNSSAVDLSATVLLKLGLVAMVVYQNHQHLVAPLILIVSPLMQNALPVPSTHNRMARCPPCE